MTRLGIHLKSKTLLFGLLTVVAYLGAPDSLGFITVLVGSAATAAKVATIAKGIGGLGTVFGLRDAQAKVQVALAGNSPTGTPEVAAAPVAA